VGGLASHVGRMWTKEHRARQLAFEQRRRYPTDLTDAEWEQVKPFLPPPAGHGRPPKADMREMLNALRYMARSGGGWRMLPVHFGPWQTVYWWFRRFVRRLLFQTVHDVALMLDRERVGARQAPRRALWTAKPSKRRTRRVAAATTRPSGPKGASGMWRWTRTGAC
jgi:transposase